MKTFDLTIDELNIVGRLTKPENGAYYSDGQFHVFDAQEIDALDTALVTLDDLVLAERRQHLIDYAGNKRWLVETGGIIVGEAMIDTSRASQAMITGAYSYSQAHPAELIQFKAVSGWVQIDAGTVSAIATAVGSHVQACFAVEAAVSAAIEAGTIASIEDIDAADWPSS